MQWRQICQIESRLCGTDAQIKTKYQRLGEIDPQWKIEKGKGQGAKKFSESLWLWKLTVNRL